MPLRDLADEFEVSERTIQRDLELLEKLGFPIEHEEDVCGKRFWRMPADYFKTAPLALSVTEAVSLHLADRLLTPLTGTYLAEGLQMILGKIRSLVPHDALDYFTELDETVYVRRMGVTDYSRHGDAIRTLIDAARTGRTMEVTYRAIWRGEEYTTRLDPYGLVFYDGDLFVVGRSHRADAVRTFKVTRINLTTATDETFVRPADFNLENHFRDSFGIFTLGDRPVEITVKFTGAVAALVEERVWHESQQLAWRPADETLFDQAADEPDTLVATYRLSGVAEFKRWIKGFGEQAEIVKPEWLRREVHDELLAAAQRHA